MTASSLPSRENGLLAEGLDAYPNLKAIIEGRIAGNFREWPAVRGELERLLMDQAELMRKASDALQSYRLASSEKATTDKADAERYRYLCREALIDYDGPDGMGYESVHLQKNLTAKGRKLYELEDDVKRLDVLIDESIVADRHTIPQGGEHG
jgi:hypothetical protein